MCDRRALRAEVLLIRADLQAVETREISGRYSAPLYDQGRVKMIGPINASALERVSSESIESDRALGLSGTSP
jgi:hypothetical protein